jgi:hypothetical protein
MNPYLAEQAAFCDYVEHTRGCSRCDTGSGRVCRLGWWLHATWWLAQAVANVAVREAAQA